MDMIKDLISSRLAQLVARFAAKGLIAVATWAKFSPVEGQVDHTAAFIGSVAGALALIAVDFISHKMQGDKAEDVGAGK